MWSLPVTLGGGMTMTKRGEPAGPWGWNRPSSIQRRYQRCSKEAGSKVFGSFREPSSASLAEGFSDIKKGARAPSKISKTRRPLLGAALELRDPPLDGHLGRVRDDLPGDFADDAIGELLDDPG